MKYLLVIPVLAVAGCVSNKTCDIRGDIRSQRAMSEQATMDAETTNTLIAWNNARWLNKYCTQTMTDQLEISKLKKSSTVRVPAECDEYMKLLHFKPTPLPGESDG